MDSKKKLWKIIVFIISVLFIAFMWVKNDVMTIYTTMPQEMVLPVIATTIAVSLIKVAAIAGGVFLLKWIISKIKQK